MAKAEILIYGPIGVDYYSGVSSVNFLSQLRELEKDNKVINIRINSPGGSIPEGLPIFNAIKSSTAEIHTYIDGIAYSMGAMIALAGHTVHAAKGSLMMLHNASGLAYGNSSEIRESADMLDKYDLVLASLIAQRLNTTDEEVMANWMNYKDNFLTAEEAKTAGFIDVIEEYKSHPIPENIKNLNFNQIAAYYAENHFTQPYIMKNIKALAGIQNPSAEQLDLANADLTELGVTNYTLVDEDFISEQERITNENQLLTQSVNNLKTEKTNLQSTIDTLNTTNQSLNEKITALEQKVADLGNNPGATHQSQNGTDPLIENDKDLDDFIANLPHNKIADRKANF